MIYKTIINISSKVRLPKAAIRGVLYEKVI